MVLGGLSPRQRARVLFSKLAFASGLVQDVNQSRAERESKLSSPRLRRGEVAARAGWDPDGSAGRAGGTPDEID